MLEHKLEDIDEEYNHKQETEEKNQVYKEYQDIREILLDYFKFNDLFISLVVDKCQKTIENKEAFKKYFEVTEYNRDKREVEMLVTELEKSLAQNRSDFKRIPTLEEEEKKAVLFEITRRRKGLAETLDKLGVKTVIILNEEARTFLSFFNDIKKYKECLSANSSDIDFEILQNKVLDIEEKFNAPIDDVQRYLKYFRLLYLDFTDIRNNVIEVNLGLVRNIVSRLNIKKRDFEDFYQQGVWILSNVLDDFNPYLGFRFTTYALQAIKRKLVYYKSVFYNLNGSIYSGNSKKVRDAFNFFREDLGKSPSVDEISSYTGLRRDTVRKILLNVKLCKTVLDNTTADGKNSLGNSIPQKNTTSYTADVQGHDLKKQIISEALDYLDNTYIYNGSISSKEVLMYLYGLEGEEPHSYSEAIEYFGFRNRGQIQFVVKKSFIHLKKFFHSSGYKVLLADVLDWINENLEENLSENEK